MPFFSKQHLVGVEVPCLFLVIASCYCHIKFDLIFSPGPWLIEMPRRGLKAALLCRRSNLVKRP